MKLRLICEGFEIDEEVTVEKWMAGDLMFSRKPPRRFEFENAYYKDDFNHKAPAVYRGWLKGGKEYHQARIILEN